MASATFGSTCLKFKMKRFLNVLSTLQNKCLPNRFDKLSILSKSLYTCNFDSDEEILNNCIGKTKIIAMNIPENKNLLTETALTKLCQSLKDFESDDELCVAILHGMGGNFCTGVEHTEKALDTAQEILQVLDKGKKPVIASLEGYTTNFGLHLAIMCDLKAMEEPGLLGFGRKNIRTEISELIYQRLLVTVGLSNCSELILTNCNWSAQKAEERGLINMTVKCGACKHL